MVGLVNDAFVIANQITQEAHNIKSQPRVQDANEELRHGTIRRLGAHGVMHFPLARHVVDVNNNVDHALHVDEQCPNVTN
jgi:hypothetical protein